MLYVETLCRHLFFFFFFLAALRSMWKLIYLDKTCASCMGLIQEGRVLTTGPPGKSLQTTFSCILALLLLIVTSIQSCYHLFTIFSLEILSSYGQTQYIIHHGV